MEFLPLLMEPPLLLAWAVAYAAVVLATTRESLRKYARDSGSKPGTDAIPGDRLKVLGAAVSIAVVATTLVLIIGVPLGGYVPWPAGVLYVLQVGAAFGISIWTVRNSTDRLLSAIASRVPPVGWFLEAVTVVATNSISRGRTVESKKERAEDTLFDLLKHDSSTGSWRSALERLWEYHRIDAAAAATFDESEEDEEDGASWPSETRRKNLLDAPGWKTQHRRLSRHLTDELYRADLEWIKEKPDRVFPQWRGKRALEDRSMRKGPRKGDHPYTDRFVRRGPPPDQVEEETIKGR